MGRESIGLGDGIEESVDGNEDEGGVSMLNVELEGGCSSIAL